MSTIEEQLAALQKEFDTAEEQMQKLRSRTYKIKDEIRDLEREREKQSKGFSEEEEKNLREQLKVLASVLTNDYNHFASLTLVDEEPGESAQFGYFSSPVSDKYSITITKCDFGMEVGEPGFNIDCVIKTKMPAVERIVRETFEQEGYTGDKNILQTSWVTNWDYHQKIRLRKTA
jgi:hypothetical protein